MATSLTLLREAAGAASDDALLDARELHLEWRELSALPSLELVSNATTLYAQHNVLTSLLDVDLLVRLVRLFIQSNELTSLSPLARCARLVVLDARDNLLADACAVAASLPRALRTLSLSGNACAAEPAYERTLRDALPALALLDGAAEGGVADAGAGAEADARAVGSDAVTDALPASSQEDALADAVADFASVREGAVARSRARVAAMQAEGAAPTLLRGEAACSIAE